MILRGAQEIRAVLAALNPSEEPATLTIYADACADYQTAQANIAEHGVVCLHPRTGAPFENPYLKIRDRAAALLLKIHIETGNIWHP